MIIATGFYTGFLPKAPGTWGTLVALPLHLLLIQFSRPVYFGAIATLGVIAVLTAGSAEKILDRKDPGPVVIDEIVGMLITLIGAPTHWLALLLGFVLFRFFDIVKPFPIGWVDRRINGGLGIVLDDCLAGLFALVFLQIICRFLPI